MGFEEMVVAIIGTVAGVGLLGYIIGKTTGLIKAWIERNKGGYDEETFDRLAKAFMQHKKDTERRLRNLETIIADDTSSPSPADRQLEEPHNTIEIEEAEREEENDQQNKSGDTDDRNLRNMLKN